ncbi:MAG: hypothetical protein M1483_05565 [Actinobacteria bacterium]|nr:hypothetical protein [Actinomycetota bacterium]MCL6105078.1 hypothetical protein [Actinomycetota bacterium]
MAARVIHDRKVPSRFIAHDQPEHLRVVGEAGKGCSPSGMSQEVPVPQQGY